MITEFQPPLPCAGTTSTKVAQGSAQPGLRHFEMRPRGCFGQPVSVPHHLTGKKQNHGMNMNHSKANVTLKTKFCTSRSLKLKNLQKALIDQQEGQKKKLTALFELLSQLLKLKDVTKALSRG